MNKQVIDDILAFQGRLLIRSAPVEFPMAKERFSDAGIARDLRVGLPSDLLTSRSDIIEA
ncbi:hypothetical protein [Edaphobacter aggregans]|uniref:hypothetical protein n=1 Tax=Edaphobacter aggregans TaxID=570835 RepID=UPI000551ABC2|nr:hypothetical protein [Edaphobacter aggregans]